MREELEESLDDFLARCDDTLEYWDGGVDSMSVCQAEEGLDLPVADSYYSQPSHTPVSTFRYRFDTAQLTFQRGQLHVDAPIYASMDIDIPSDPSRSFFTMEQVARAESFRVKVMISPASLASGRADIIQIERDRMWKGLLNKFKEDGLPYPWSREVIVEHLYDSQLDMEQMRLRWRPKRQNVEARIEYTDGYGADCQITWQLHDIDRLPFVRIPLSVLPSPWPPSRMVGPNQPYAESQLVGYDGYRGQWVYQEASSRP